MWRYVGRQACENQDESTGSSGLWWLVRARGVVNRIRAGVTAKHTLRIPQIMRDLKCERWGKRPVHVKPLPAVLIIVTDHAIGTRMATTRAHARANIIDNGGSTNVVRGVATSQQAWYEVREDTHISCEQIVPKRAASKRGRA